MCVCVCVINALQGPSTEHRQISVRVVCGQIICQVKHISSRIQGTEHQAWYYFQLLWLFLGHKLVAFLRREQEPLHFRFIYGASS